MIEIKGFYITSMGDPSVGIFESSWNLNGDFYFENQNELNDFKDELITLYESYVDFNVNVETYDEIRKRIDVEEQLLYLQYPVRYLIKDKDYNLFKQADSAATYSSNVGTAIHLKLPDWISENESYDTKVIKSTSPEFKKILSTEADNLENEINDLEYKLKSAKQNLSLIKLDLKYDM